MKTIYYYQTFVGLKNLMNHVQDIDVIIISSIHFGKNSAGKYGIYLNDNIPTNNIFDQLWLETEQISSEGCTIMLMMGGAGGAYNELFSNFNIYYPQLVQLIHLINLKPFKLEKKWIEAIKSTKYGVLMTDNDYDDGLLSILAHKINEKTEKKVHLLGLKNKSAGHTELRDNLPPNHLEIIKKVKELTISNKKLK